MEGYIISQYAGRIWCLLCSGYIEKADSIKFKLGIDEFKLFVALGWLSRDKNIYIININGELYLSNKSNSESFNCHIL